jgi:hypothetical protein
MIDKNIGQLAQGASECLNQIKSTQSREPAIQYLANLKLAYQKDGEYNCPNDFFQAKAIRDLSDGVISISTVEDRSAFLLNFGEREDKDDLIGILKKYFTPPIQTIGGEDFYLSDKYVFGILI